MTQAYQTLPTMSVFFLRAGVKYANSTPPFIDFFDAPVKEAGWYYLTCLKHIPEGDPKGPYDTEDDAKVACMDKYL